MNKIIVMFDMDGTLTESRLAFDETILSDSIYQLTNHGIHFGIITGSDEDYLREQMGGFLSKTSSRFKTHLLPCNGTKYFKPPEFPNEDFKLEHEVSMESHLGVKEYRTLMQELIYSQVDMASEGVPLTGHFINCRGSLVNWCPIGRNANADQRQEFIEIDNERKIRSRVITELKVMLKQKGLSNKVTLKFGGDTSFDIYPRGWDKTYGLRHFAGWDVWFVGDRCEPEGNDYEIFQACTGQSYVSNGPTHTKEIINDIITRIRSKQ